MGCCKTKEKSPDGQIKAIENGAREADFSGRQLRRDQLCRLSTAVMSSCNITSLLLSWISLRDRGLALIEESLGGCRSLEVLVLAGNGLTDKGAAAIARVVEAAPNLRVLSLAENKITREGLGVLVKAVAKSSTLTDLRLGGNRVLFKDVDDAMEVLEPLVGRKHKLTFFDLRGNPVSHEMLKEISERMSRPANNTLHSNNSNNNNVSTTLHPFSTSAVSITNSELFTTQNRDDERDKRSFLAPTSHVYSPKIGKANPLAATSLDGTQDTQDAHDAPDANDKTPTNKSDTIDIQAITPTVDEPNGAP
eukprot:TRINITY_DN16752_c0_g1_i1.p1 TRINITY_DN16752_c0_g1~~TRINITY_DN16752_c0_g1_i1.p1  ORF type:complete len:307 (+),score=49.37 TRINITY_DN16752_c0_g1_i1:455-1375(+)